MLLISRPRRPLDRPTDITLESHKIDRRREAGRGKGGRKYNTDTAWCASVLDQRLRDTSPVGAGTISKLMLYPKCAAVMDGASVTPLTVQNKREMANGKVGGVLASEFRGLLDKLSTRKSGGEKEEALSKPNQCSPRQTRHGEKDAGWRASRLQPSRVIAIYAGLGTDVRTDRTDGGVKTHLERTSERVRNLVLSSYREIFR